MRKDQKLPELVTQAVMRSCCEKLPSPRGRALGFTYKATGPKAADSEFAEDVHGVIDHMITGSKLWNAAGGPVGKTTGFHCRGAQAHSLVRELKYHMLLGVAKKKKKKQDVSLHSL